MLILPIFLIIYFRELEMGSKSPFGGIIDCNDISRPPYVDDTPSHHLAQSSLVEICYNHLLPFRKKQHFPSFKDRWYLVSHVESLVNLTWIHVLAFIFEFRHIVCHSRVRRI